MAVRPLVLGWMRERRSELRRTTASDVRDFLEDGDILPAVVDEDGDDVRVSLKSICSALKRWGITWKKVTGGKRL
jgi:hypothetical protein